MTNKLSPAEVLRKHRNLNGRPKKSATEKMGKKITVKITTVEFYALRAKAKEAGMNVSQLARSALQNCTIKEQLSATHLRLITQLTGMANNLNQIAKRANQAGYLAAKSESETLAKSIDRIIKSIEYES